MLDVAELLRELNEVLAKHDARFYAFGHDFGCWVNNKSDDWAEEVAAIHCADGKFEEIA